MTPKRTPAETLARYDACLYVSEKELAQFKARFWERVRKTRGCWQWTGHINHLGYGKLHHGIKSMGRYMSAHRASLWLCGKKIPDGLVVDHLCRNKSCVNPKHLDIVTVRENTLRGIGISAINAKKTVCKRGHKFTKKSTGFHSVHGYRFCKICKITLNKSYQKRTDRPCKAPGCARAGVARSLCHMHKRERLEPAMLKLTKVQLAQSPLAIEMGWEQKLENDYWTDASGNLYKLERIHTKTIDEFLADQTEDRK